ncbi:TonB-dependent receptor [Rhodoplanes sp. TEM]|uniref:TonB-dependent receptor n=1 Tax=Rhodoplanes tepidamans TaxID=200616 RepID=A0ABT5J7Q1_RHOTP|nr:MULTISPECIES: TonB-dependent receptor [Rhodoplanes]MDC7785667.1 TonB-dependent receptor [Rhodoplanes tepidamans]MDC7983308.1 TonB-dependent receptor [Rhodoplanes sp. TEM]MDQ0354766.1 iron complex outermembrane receptor protein [Rhodoplanes tepidamans]
MSRLIRAFCAASAAVAACSTAFAQSTALPPLVVEGGSAPAGGTSSGPAAGTATSLTVPTAAQAEAALARVPGAVAVVPDTAFKTGPARTAKDILDWVPGVWIEPKWGDDSRLSIRGSGLSRNFHLRGVQLYMDGIPINTSDGYGDFQEIDPTAYRYVEVFKGANGLRFGANALGGAINFVMPTGRDAPPLDTRIDVGGFGFVRGQAAVGGSAGPWDGFATVSSSMQDGYRDHSWGNAERASGNVGYRFSPDVETRVYVNANSVRQRIPGEVTKSQALASPQTAATNNLANDWQRNIDTLRIGSKTTVKLDSTVIELGLFGVDRHLMHPIYQWLDYRYEDWGGFARATDERLLLGHRNRVTLGVNVLNGTIHADQYANTGGAKGALLSSRVQRPENYTAYAENAFYAVPTFSIVAGTQYLYAVRDQEVLYSVNGDLNGRASFSLWSPKIGAVWDVSPDWQVFGNVSRSAEVPSFGESVAPNFLNPSLPSIPFYDIRPQRATTFEIGTRGRRPDVTWDVALYRAEITDELMCLYSSFGSCNVTNADRTVHQGVELGLGLSLLKNIAVAAGTPDRLWLQVAYTWNDFRFDGDPVFGDNRLPGAPPHIVKAELLYMHPGGWSFGPTLEWVPQAYFVDSANTLATDPYVLWGLKAAYDDGTLSAYVEARNLADVTYISSASIIDRATTASTLFNPGTGRAVYAGLRWRM